MEIEQKGPIWGPPYIESRFHSPRGSADFDQGRENGTTGREQKASLGGKRGQYRVN